MEILLNASRMHILHSVLLMKTWEVGSQDSESPFTTLILMWVPRLVWLRLGSESAGMCLFFACFLQHATHCMVNIAP